MPIAVRTTPTKMTRADLQGAGIDGGIVQIEPVHNTVD